MRQGVEVVRARVARAVGVGSHSVHRQPRTGRISGYMLLHLCLSPTGQKESSVEQPASSLAEGRTELYMALSALSSFPVSDGSHSRAVHGYHCP